MVVISGSFLVSTMAQDIELTGFYGYTFNSKART